MYVGRIKYLLLLVSIFVLGACTRNINNSKIDIPLSSLNKKVSSLNTEYPVHIIANVHYQGVTKVDEWDCNRESSSSASQCVLPDALSFNDFVFPNGETAILQVLLVYENENEQLRFYYADKEFTFVGGTQEILLNSWFDSGFATNEAVVAGRLIDANNEGPTGMVVGYYTPPVANRPEMKLFRSNIVGGFFKFFFLEGMQLSYKLVDPQLNPIKTLYNNFDPSSITLSGSSTVTKFKIPEHYVVHNGPNNSYESRKRNSENVYLGHFDINNSGQAFSGTSVTEYYGSTEALPDSYRYLSGGVLVDPIDPTTGDFTPDETTWSSRLFYWNGSSPTTEEAGYVSGASSTSCSGDYVNLNCMRFNHTGISDRDYIPFQGPFQMFDSSNETTLLDFNEVSTDIVFDLKLITGIAGDPSIPAELTSKAIHGVSMFLVPQDSIDKNGGADSFTPCHRIAVGAGIASTGFTADNSGIAGSIHHQTIVGTSGITDLSFTIDKTLLVNEVNNGKIPVFCPYSQTSGSKKYLPVAVFNDHIGENLNNGGGGNSGPATQILIKPISTIPNNSQMGINTCMVYEVYPADANGNMANMDNTDSIQITTSDNANVNFNAGPDCSVVDTVPSNIASNVSGHVHRFVSLASTTATGNFTISASTTGSTLSSTSHTVTVINNTVDPTKTQIVPLWQARAYECIESLVMFFDSNNILASGTAGTHSITGATADLYYSGNNCFSTTTSATTVAGPYLGSIAIKPSPGTRTYTLFDGSYSATTTISVATPGTPVNLELGIHDMGLGHYFSGMCYDASIRSTDSNHAPSPVAAATIVNFSNFTDYEIFSDSNCTSSASSISLAASVHEAFFSIRFKTTSPATQIISASGFNTNNYDVMSFIDQTQIMIVNNSVFGGGPVCQTVYVQLVDSSYTPIDGQGGFDTSYWSNKGINIDIMGNLTADSATTNWGNCGGSNGGSTIVTGTFDGMFGFDLSPSTGGGSFNLDFNSSIPGIMPSPVETFSVGP